MDCKSRELVFRDCQSVSYPAQPFDSWLLCQTQDGQPARVLLAEGYPVAKAFVLDPESLREDVYCDPNFTSCNAGLISHGYFSPDVVYTPMRLAQDVIDGMKADAAILAGKFAEFDRLRDIAENMQAVARHVTKSADYLKASARMLRDVDGMDAERESIEKIRARLLAQIDKINHKKRDQWSEYRSLQSELWDYITCSHPRLGLDPFTREILFERGYCSLARMASTVDRQDGCGGETTYTYTNPLTGKSLVQIRNNYCGGFSCFTENASVYLQDGSSLTMKEMADRFVAGDVPEIATMNEVTGEIEYTRPDKVIVHGTSSSPDLLSITFAGIGGEAGTVTVTPNHPMAVCDGPVVEYVPAGNLYAGATLCGGMGDDAVVLDIEPTPFILGGLYDLHIDEGNHNYLVSDEGKPVVAHNKMF